jgi:uncharacterized protein HemX
MSDDLSGLPRAELEQRLRTALHTLTIQREAAARGRRRTDPPGDDHMTERGQGGVTWKWLVGVLVGVLVIAGGAWATSMQAQVNRVDSKLDEASKNTSTQASDIAVIKERLRVIEDRMKEQQESAKETNKKLDELLRKIK